MVVGSSLRSGLEGVVGGGSECPALSLSLHPQYHDWGALEQGTEPPTAPWAPQHSTQTDIFQVFIYFNFDYNWQLMKTPNSVSQKIRILWKGSILKTPGATL